LPSAGSENPTMTWRVTPSPASIATRAAIQGDLRAGAMSAQAAKELLSKKYRASWVGQLADGAVREGHIPISLKLRLGDSQP
jgi:hypothetical protein